MPRGVTPGTTEATGIEAQSSPETNQQRTCPLCEFDAGEQSDIYTHLQTSHRKSTLAAAILDETAEF